MKRLKEELLLLDRVKKDYPEVEYKTIEKALDYASTCHSEQKRKNGVPYIVHPIAVAEILLDLGMDYKTICAGLMHDCLEDTDATYEEIKSNFDAEIADLVNGVSKVKSLKFKRTENDNIENLRKMFVAMAKDIRVIIIKFADRLHNMRTIDAVAPEQQLRKSIETMDIYVPLLERLGMFNIKAELEDICFRHIYPREYEKIKSEIENNYTKNKKELSKINKELEKMLKELNIDGKVQSRFKNLYSIYKKSIRMFGVSELFDIFAHRIMVESVKDCYLILGEVHNRWKPLPGKIKDYIANPKKNGYQSLHTTCINESGVPFEIQIRTFEMHKDCEYGIAAHWKYKNDNKASNFDEKLNFLRQVLEDSNEVKGSNDFLTVAKSELTNQNIFAFTPLRKVIELPKNSNPIDFAYEIHTNVGNKCVGAKINGKMVPLTTKIETGDTVEIITSASSKGPSRDWLKIVQSSSARSKIRNFFKKTMKDENIKLGKDMIELEVKRRGKTYNDFFGNLEINELICDRYSFESLDDMFASIGYGGVTPSQILSRINYEQKQKMKYEVKVSNNIKRREESKCPAVVNHAEDLPTRLARCCNPVMGDDIIGFVSQGRGISIHRTDCTNIRNCDSQRLLKVHWIETKDAKYSVNLQIKAIDSKSLVNKITNVFSNMQNISLQGINATVNKEFASIGLLVSISNKNQITEICNKISAIDGIISCYRI